MTVPRKSFLIATLLCGNFALAATTAFVNVNVLPMSSEEIIGAQTVVVVDRLIRQIGNVDEISIPEDAEIVDGTDRFLMPGLGEMHAHVPDATSPDLDRYFSLFVANGVTTIRGMLGRPSHIALRQELLDGKVFGPRLYTAGPSLSGRSVAGSADARRRVRQQAAAGYDFIKLHPGLSADEFTAIASTARELEIPFAGHVPVAVGVAVALQLGMTAIDHLDGYLVALLPPERDRSGGYGGLFDVLLASDAEVARIEPIVAATVAAGTWNVATQVLIEQMVSETDVAELENRPEMRYMPAATVRDWVASKKALMSERGFDAEVARRALSLRRQLVLALHDGGAGLLLGSDAPQVFNVPGFSLHRELDALVAAGLTPFEALQAGTTAVARFFDSNAGYLLPGKDADLVLLDANPFEDIRNSRRIHGVMLRGAWLPASALQERLHRYQRNSDQPLLP